MGNKFSVQRVLVFYVNPQTGHHSAALAIEQAFQQKYPHVDVMVLDFMKFINPVVAQLLMQTYKSLIKRSPSTWQYLYDNPRVLQTTEKIRNATMRMNLTRIRKVMTEFNPQVVICTQAIPCGALAYYQREKKVDFSLMAVSTDFLAHSYWFHDEVDAYIVPSAKEKTRLMASGIEASRTHAFGIPVQPKFLIKRKSLSLKEKYGLNENMFTILLMGGSQGLGRLDEVVKRIAKIPAAFQLLIVAGTNKDLLKDLNGYQKKGKHSRYIRVFSHVDYVDELMEMADLIITKPGGLTTSEAMAKSCPMILINPLPGQERQNADYLVAEGAAIMVEEQDDLIQLLSRIVEDPAQLKSIVLQQERIKKPHSAFDIAALVMREGA